MELSEIRGSNFLRKTYDSSLWKLIFWLVEVIFPIFQRPILEKSIFRLAETCFETNFSFRMVKTDVWSCGNRFPLFNLFFYKWKPSLKLMVYFLRNNLSPVIERYFLSSGSRFLLLRASFLRVETVSETS